jgi:HPt (histidine-containing phosphotransfer) domain-containing protein
MTELIDRSVLDGLSEAVGEDFVGELIDTFLEEAPGMFEEMKQALEKNDVDRFRRAAHSLKTNASTFGANELAEQAKELEYMARENNLDIGNRLELLDEAYKQAAGELNSLK